MKNLGDFKIRQSNIELLRVLSMFFVLMVHSNYMGILSVYDSPYNFETFFRFLIESVAIVGVNCFVLVSGFFGINLRKDNLANIIFQTYFFSLLALFMYLLLHGVHDVPKTVLVRSFFPLANYIWFLPCYLLLMFFSPILNSWLKQTSTKKVFSLVVIIYAVTYFWQVAWKQNLGFGGYSFGFFILLYIIGNLISRLKDTISKYKIISGGGYIVCVMLLMIISVLQYKFPVFKSMLWSYNCPIVLAESIFLFVFFCGLNIKNNRVINWFGRSSFSVLLVHISVVSTYHSWLEIVDVNVHGIMKILLSLLILVFYYLLSVLIDQVRLWLWNKYLKPIFKK